MMERSILGSRARALAVLVVVGLLVAVVLPALGRTHRRESGGIRTSPMLCYGLVRNSSLRTRQIGSIDMIDSPLSPRRNLVINCGDIPARLAIS